MKQYAGMFKGWKDATVILTRDLFIHVYPFNDKKVYSKLIDLSMTTTDHHDGRETLEDYTKPLASFKVTNLTAVSMKGDKLDLGQARPKHPEKKMTDFARGKAKTIVNKLKEI